MNVNNAIEPMKDEEAEATHLLAIHEAGHFIAELAGSRHPPFHTCIVPEWGWGLCVPAVPCTDIAHAGIVAMGGYAAEAYCRNGKFTPDELAPYMEDSPRDYDDYVKLLRGDHQVTEDMLRLTLGCFNLAQLVIRRNWRLARELAQELESRRRIGYDHAMALHRKWTERDPASQPDGFQRIGRRHEARLRRIVRKEEAEARRIWGSASA